MKRPAVPRRWIRGPADELAIAEGCWFDPEGGAFVAEFLEGFCCQSKGEWAGQPLRLMPWQRDFIDRLYGWKRPDGSRRYRKGYLEVPKKNGKSTKISGLSVYHLVGDDEQGPEVYINACDRQQASIVYDEAERMVKASPELSKILAPVPSKKRIAYPAGNGSIQASSAEVAAKDGLNPSFTIFDELHRQKTSAMFDIFEYAGAARRQPLNLTITTAGEDLRSVCFREHEYAKGVNSGKIPDTRFLGVIYAADRDDDFEDPKVWAKANPSLGHTIKVDDFAAELLAAKRTPATLANFLRLRLNLWNQDEAGFIREADWARGAGAIDPAALAGRPCYGGLDLSTTTDLTAFVLIFGDQVGGFEVLAWFWLPAENIDRLELRDRVPYREWARQGFITLTDGNVIDYEFVRATVREQAARWKLRKLHSDPYNATQLGLQLIADGIPFEFLRQGFLSLSAPTKELERLALGGKIRHGNNPVLGWNVDSCRTEIDAAGSIKLSKRKSRQKIDGAAALVNAIAAAIGEDQAGPSVYETQGIRRL